MSLKCFFFNRRINENLDCGGKKRPVRECHFCLKKILTNIRNLPFAKHSFKQTFLFYFPANPYASHLNPCESSHFVAKVDRQRICFAAESIKSTQTMDFQESNMEKFDKRENAVPLSPWGRKSKRKPDQYKGNVKKSERHSGRGKQPGVSCTHDRKTCQVAKLSSEEITFIDKTLYCKMSRCCSIWTSHHLNVDVSMSKIWHTRGGETCLWSTRSWPTHKRESPSLQSLVYVPVLWVF